MPIHLIQGKPGSGKSLYAVSRLINELVEGRRNIVTNLPLRMDRLNVYLQKTYPDLDTRMLQRVRVMSDDEMRFFYKFRSPDDPPMPTLEPIRPAEEVRNGMKAADIRRVLADQEREAQEHRERDKVLQCLPQSRLGEHGVAYYLDEAHIAFNARNWSATGPGALHYLSQHRKLSDIVWPITQDAKNLDGQFLRVAEDFTVLRNEYNAKYGPFRGRGRFVRRTYLSVPSGGSAEPFETATFSLDVEGVASCYDTAKGIGVHGTKADVGSRAKGWSIWWTVPLAFGLAALVGLVPWLMGKGAGKFVGGKAKTTTTQHTVTKPLAGGGTSTQTTTETVTVAPNPNPTPTPLPSFLGAKPVLADARPERTVWVVGYVQRGQKINVVLSDGRTITEDDKTMVQRTRNFVDFVNGDRLWMMSPGGRSQLNPSPTPMSLGAGGGSPPDRQRAEAAAEDFAVLTGRGATVAETAEAIKASTPYSPSPSFSNRPKRSGPTYDLSPRTADPVISPRSSFSAPTPLPNRAPNAMQTTTGRPTLPLPR